MSENTHSDTGYICKQCEGPAPVGVGYVVQGWTGTPDSSRTACPCGHSVKPESAGVWQAIELAEHSANPKHGRIIAEVEADSRQCPQLIRDLWKPGRVVIGWTFNKPIKRLAPETLAKRRRTRLANKLQQRVPLLAAELFERETTARPGFFEGRE